MCAGGRYRPACQWPNHPLTSTVWLSCCAAGIPSTVVIAASFDDIVAITGYSIFVSIAIQSGGNTAWQIAEGPLQVGPPAVATAAAAYMCLQ